MTVRAAWQCTVGRWHTAVVSDIFRGIFGWYKELQCFCLSVDWRVQCPLLSTTHLTAFFSVRTCTMSVCLWISLTHYSLMSLNKSRSSFRLTSIPSIVSNSHFTVQGAMEVGWLSIPICPKTTNVRITKLQESLALSWPKMHKNSRISTSTLENFNRQWPRSNLGRDYSALPRLYRELPLGKPRLLTCLY